MDPLALARRLGVRPVSLLGLALALVLASATAAQGTAAPSDGPGLRWVGRFDATLAPWQEIRLKSGQRPNTFRFAVWDEVKAVEAGGNIKAERCEPPLSFCVPCVCASLSGWRCGGAAAPPSLPEVDSFPLLI